MAASVTIEMGGIACGVMARAPALVELLAQRYREFLSDRPPRFTITAGIHGGAPRDNPLEIDPGPVAIERRGDRLLLSGERVSAEFDLVSHRGTIVQPLNLTPLDLLLKAVYAHYLLGEEAAFVHGCALSHGRHGSLFFGPSGSGKSTLAGLAGQAPLSHAGVLADELVIVRRRGDPARPGFSVQGTPFWGGCNATAELTGLYALSTDRRHNAVAPMTPARALRRLLPCLGNFSADDGATARLFDLAGSLVRTTACEELRFSTPSAAKGWLDAHLH
jgi:hypothetical protein